MKNGLDILFRLMDKHGLIFENWTAKYLRKGTYMCYGLCVYNKQQIRINREFCEDASEEEIIDVCLHEIAHALVYLETGRCQKHNNVWKAKCIEIGANPERLYSGNIRVKGNSEQTRRYRYGLCHIGTGEIYKRYMRRPKRVDFSTYYIKDKFHETYGNLELVTFGGIK